ncbi:MAG: YicC/YloC family endoribonuclease [Candidatus Omnitrophota bacterium]|jgi:uncharacterized protein (TIGR00255 family)
MIKSMTGFGSKEALITPFGKVSIELRSTNHKFLESVFHLPEGFLSLEDRIKKEIEARIKRGRVTCAINISGSKDSRVFINKGLLKRYIAGLKSIKKEFSIKEELSINTLIHLPGILSLEENNIPASSIWPRLKILLNAALDELVKMRAKEGRALFGFFKSKADSLDQGLKTVRASFKNAVAKKVKALTCNEERSAFLKDADITEEMERLTFHVRNFKSKLSKNIPVGKELDFIAQEMQREANTMAAKSFDAGVSAKVVQMKSQIEKIREQVQNIE